jgi:hypothetical protein
VDGGYLDYASELACLDEDFAESNAVLVVDVEQVDGDMADSGAADQVRPFPVGAACCRTGSGTCRDACQRLGVAVRVIDRQPFGQGGGGKVGVRREQGQRWEPSLRIECGGKLYGVITPQAVLSRQGGGLVYQGGGDLDDEVWRAKSSWKSARAVAASVGVMVPPRSRRVIAATASARVIRTMMSEWPAAGAARACTHGVPVSWTYRLRTVLVSRKNSGTVSDARGGPLRRWVHLGWGRPDDSGRGSGR